MDGAAAKSQFFLAETGGGVSDIPQEKQAKHPIFAENLQEFAIVTLTQIGCHFEEKKCGVLSTLSACSPSTISDVVTTGSSYFILDARNATDFVLLPQTSDDYGTSNISAFLVSVCLIIIS
ncbi:hypothetical protein KIN20_017951 [Parelaphostrongylus tenuis]|uniref:Uncharacterized protein n=1 Tax=Parelaphostrongylus tenuis TaxID=148309 RepID=A0AAD5QRS4_PARTN|nr:hypothetical protein KIN20_017951 [Parelaphostrongylus tenuis]